MKLSDYKNNLFLQNIAYAIGFGILSYLFGLIQFKLPGVDGNITDLREIPFLVSTIFITNPLYLLITVAITTLGTLPEGSHLSMFVMHAGAIMPTWYMIRLIRKKAANYAQTGLFTIPVVLIYYYALLLPLLVIMDHASGLNRNLSFIEFYISLADSVPFEVTTTAIITGLFIVQYEVRTQLKEHLAQLEEIVQERTLQLEETVNELNATNEKLLSTNDYLDKRVLERTRELESRNAQLTEYAFVNAHQLRAPLARILGLANLLKMENKNFSTDPLFSKFVLCCDELDEVVHLLGEMLQENSNLDEQELFSLKERIRTISNNISKG